MNAIMSFFANFFKNLCSDPISSTKGVLQVAAGVSTAVATAKGHVDPAVGVPTSTGFIAAGLHALGTDSRGNTLDAVKKAEEALTQVGTVAPQVIAITSAVKDIKKNQDGTAKTIEAALKTVESIDSTLKLNTKS